MVQLLLLRLELDDETALVHERRGAEPAGDGVEVGGKVGHRERRR